MFFPCFYGFFAILCYTIYIVNKKRMVKEMKIEKQLNWLVGYKIEGKEYDDKKDRFSICAAFAYYESAVAYIEQASPSETRERIYIVNRKDLEKAESLDDLQQVPTNLKILYLE